MLIVATETGLLHRLRKEAPDKPLLAADEGTVCRYMKQIPAQAARHAPRSS